MPFSAAFLTVALVAQVAPAPSVDATSRAYFLFLDARSIADRDPDAAITRYREALALLGDSSDIRTELATLYARRNQVAEARTEVERALAIDADNRAAHRLLGLIEASDLDSASDDTANAIAARAAGHLERALADGFRDATVQLTLAEVYSRMGRYTQAITLLNDFLLDRPGYPQAVLLLMDAYRRSGQDELADDLVRSLGGTPGASGAASTLAVERLEQAGQWREAADAWARLGESDPANPRYPLRRATAQANSGDLDSARDTLSALLAKSPDEVAAYFLLVQIELRDGQPDAAEGAALRITQVDPADPRGPLTLAEVRSSRNNYRGVVAALETRVNEASTVDVESGAYAQMARLLSVAYQRLNDGKRAVSTMEAARRRAPEDLQVLFSLAATYEQTGDADRAEQTFRDLIAADPSHAAGLNYLGYMLAERGRKLDEAVSFINRALALDADNPSYLDSLGWAYFKQSRYEDAVSPLERAAAGAPGSSVIQDHLGDLYVKLGRYGDAVAAFARALEADGDGIDASAIQKKRDAARARIRSN